MPKKPVKPQELAARLHAVSRRGSSQRAIAIADWRGMLEGRIQGVPIGRKALQINLN